MRWEPRDPSGVSRASTDSTELRHDGFGIRRVMKGVETYNAVDALVCEIDAPSIELQKLRWRAIADVERLQQHGGVHQQPRCFIGGAQRFREMMLPIRQ